MRLPECNLILLAVLVSISPVRSSLNSFETKQTNKSELISQETPHTYKVIDNVSKGWNANIGNSLNDSYISGKPNGEVIKDGFRGDSRVETNYDFFSGCLKDVNIPEECFPVVSEVKGKQWRKSTYPKNLKHEKKKLTKSDPNRYRDQTVVLEPLSQTREENKSNEINCYARILLSFIDRNPDLATELLKKYVAGCLLAEYSTLSPKVVFDEKYDDLSKNKVPDKIKNPYFVEVLQKENDSKDNSTIKGEKAVNECQNNGLKLDTTETSVQISHTKSLEDTLKNPYRTSSLSSTTLPPDQLSNRIEINVTSTRNKCVDAERSPEIQPIPTVTPISDGQQVQEVEKLLETVKRILSVINKAEESSTVLPNFSKDYTRISYKPKATGCQQVRGLSERGLKELLKFTINLNEPDEHSQNSIRLADRKSSDMFVAYSDSVDNESEETFDCFKLMSLLKKLLCSNEQIGMKLDRDEDISCHKRPTDSVQFIPTSITTAITSNERESPKASSPELVESTTSLSFISNGADVSREENLLSTTVSLKESGISQETSLTGYQNRLKLLTTFIGRKKEQLPKSNRYMTYFRDTLHPQLNPLNPNQIFEHKNYKRDDTRQSIDISKDVYRTSASNVIESVRSTDPTIASSPFFNNDGLSKRNSSNNYCEFFNGTLGGNELDDDIVRKVIRKKGFLNKILLSLFRSLSDDINNSNYLYKDDPLEKCSNSEFDTSTNGIASVTNNKPSVHKKIENIICKNIRNKAEKLQLSFIKYVPETTTDSSNTMLRDVKLNSKDRLKQIPFINESHYLSYNVGKPCDMWSNKNLVSSAPCIINNVTQKNNSTLNLHKSVASKDSRSKSKNTSLDIATKNSTEKTILAKSKFRFNKFLHNDKRIPVTSATGSATTGSATTASASPDSVSTCSVTTGTTTPCSVNTCSVIDYGALPCSTTYTNQPLLSTQSTYEILTYFPWYSVPHNAMSNLTGEKNIYTINLGISSSQASPRAISMVEKVKLTASHSVLLRNNVVVKSETTEVKVNNSTRTSNKTGFEIPVTGIVRLAAMDSPVSDTAFTSTDLTDKNLIYSSYSDSPVIKSHDVDSSAFTELDIWDCSGITVTISYRDTVTDAGLSNSEVLDKSGDIYIASPHGTTDSIQNNLYYLKNELRDKIQAANTEKTTRQFREKTDNILEVLTTTSRRLSNSGTPSTPNKVVDEFIDVFNSRTVEGNVTTGRSDLRQNILRNHRLQETKNKKVENVIHESPTSAETVVFTSSRPVDNKKVSDYDSISGDRLRFHENIGINKDVELNTTHFYANTDVGSTWQYNFGPRVPVNTAKSPFNFSSLSQPIRVNKSEQVVTSEKTSVQLKSVINTDRDFTNEIGEKFSPVVTDSGSVIKQNTSFFNNSKSNSGSYDFLKSTTDVFSLTTCTKQVNDFEKHSSYCNTVKETDSVKSSFEDTTHPISSSSVTNQFNLLEETNYIETVNDYYNTPLNQVRLGQVISFVTQRNLDASKHTDSSSKSKSVILDRKSVFNTGIRNSQGFKEPSKNLMSHMIVNKKTTQNRQNNLDITQILSNPQPGKAKESDDSENRQSQLTGSSNCNHILILPSMTLDQSTSVKETTNKRNKPLARKSLNALNKSSNISDGSHYQLFTEKEKLQVPNSQFTGVEDKRNLSYLCSDSLNLSDASALETEYNNFKTNSSIKRLFNILKKDKTSNKVVNNLVSIGEIRMLPPQEEEKLIFTTPSAPTTGKRNVWTPSQPVPQTSPLTKTDYVSEVPDTNCKEKQATTECAGTLTSNIPFSASVTPSYSRTECPAGENSCRNISVMEMINKIDRLSPLNLLKTIMNALNDSACDDNTGISLGEKIYTNNRGFPHTLYLSDNKSSLDTVRPMHINKYNSTAVDLSSTSSDEDIRCISKIGRYSHVNENTTFDKPKAIYLNNTELNATFVASTVHSIFRETNSSINIVKKLFSSEEVESAVTQPTPSMVTDGFNHESTTSAGYRQVGSSNVGIEISVTKDTSELVPLVETSIRNNKTESEPSDEEFSSVSNASDSLSYISITSINDRLTSENNEKDYSTSYTTMKLYDFSEADQTDLPAGEASIDDVELCAFHSGNHFDSDFFEGISVSDKQNRFRFDRFSNAQDRKRDLSPWSSKHYRSKKNNRIVKENYSLKSDKRSTAPGGVDDTFLVFPGDLTEEKGDNAPNLRWMFNCKRESSTKNTRIDTVESANQDKKESRSVFNLNSEKSKNNSTSNSLYRRINIFRRLGFGKNESKKDKNSKIVDTKLNQDSKNKTTTILLNKPNHLKELKKNHARYNFTTVFPRVKSIEKYSSPSQLSKQDPSTLWLKYQPAIESISIKSSMFNIYSPTTASYSIPKNIFVSSSNFSFPRNIFGTTEKFLSRKAGINSILDEIETPINESAVDTTVKPRILTVVDRPLFNYGYRKNKFAVAGSLKNKSEANDFNDRALVLNRNRLSDYATESALKRWSISELTASYLKQTTLTSLKDYLSFVPIGVTTRPRCGTISDVIPSTESVETKYPIESFAEITAPRIISSNKPSVKYEITYPVAESMDNLKPNFFSSVVDTNDVNSTNTKVDVDIVTSKQQFVDELDAVKINSNALKGNYSMTASKYEKNEYFCNLTETTPGADSKTDKPTPVNDLSPIVSATTDTIPENAITLNNEIAQTTGIEQHSSNEKLSETEFVQSKNLSKPDKETTDLRENLSEMDEVTSLSPRLKGEKQNALKGAKVLIVSTNNNNSNKKNCSNYKNKKTTHSSNANFYVLSKESSTQHFFPHQHTMNQSMSTRNHLCTTEVVPNNYNN